MTADRIFIHAWWRSGSTYVWSKLRENESLVCYYEPLHDRNARLTMEDVGAPAEVKISRGLRHPMQSKSYFSEYAALVHSNNLGFSQSLSYDRFLLQPDEIDNELKVYLDRLLKAAAEVKRTAVLSFCRSQMRSAWMKKVFGGIHIAQIRNPLDQWASFHVEPYFRDKMLIIALNLRRLHPAAFAHIEAFERFARSMSKHPPSVAKRLFDTFIAETDALAVFLTIWLGSALQAISFADFILDIDRLSSDPDSRKTAEKWLATIECRVDFSDCLSPSWDDLAVPRSEFERLVGDAAMAVRSNAASLVIANPDTVRSRLASLSQASGKILRTALAD